MDIKEAYIKKAKAKVAEQVAWLCQLKEGSITEFSDTKIKTQESIESLERKIEYAKSHIGEISEAAWDAWEEIKNRNENLTDNISCSLKRLFQKENEL